jgi:hypothetical protein
MLESDRRESLSQLLKQFDQSIDFTAKPEADVGSDLVIARASGMQTFTRITHQLNQSFLNVEVNIFEV